MSFRFYNTLTRKKEEFKPLKDGEVGLYSCGPTVYWYQHLGNMRAYVLWDLLKRSLQYGGFKVHHVVNITDVGHLTDDGDEGDDKMEIAAKKEGKTVWDIAKYYTEVFMKDIKALNILEPDVWCRATDHIQEQIDMITQMEKNGFTYETSDGVYFDTSKLDDYGKLAGNFDAEKLKGGSRVDLGEKKNKTDFALWKFCAEDNRQMEWDSPWGKGFPGWHIECTAMGCKYLGDTFDIHTGGEEHIPVHHTNEIAQAQGAMGHDHVRVWLHNGWLMLEGDKFSKSLGHSVRVSDLKEKGFEPMDFRYFLLQAHYHRPQTFTWEALEASKTARDRLMQKIIDFKDMQTPSELSDERMAFQSRFVERIQDDLDIPGALGVLHEMLKSDLSAHEKLSLALDWDQVFGLGLKHAHRPQVDVPPDIQALLDERKNARDEKNYQRSDEIRDQLLELGWVVSDGPDGQKIEPK